MSTTGAWLLFGFAEISEFSMVVKLFGCSSRMYCLDGWSLLR